MIKSIVSNSFVLLVGNSVGRLTVFITNIIAARMLNVDLFGQYMVIRSTFNVLERIVSVSIGNLTIREISKDTLCEKSKVKEAVLAVLLINLLFSFVFAFLIYVFSIEISELFFLGEANIVKGLYYGCILLFFIFLASSTQKIMIGFEIYSGIVALSFINLIISVPIAWIVIKEYGFFGAIIGAIFYYFIDSSAKIFFIYRSLRKKIDNRFIVDLRYVLSFVKRLLFNCKALLLSGVMTSIAFWYFRVYAVNQQNNFRDIAIFDAAYQWMTMIMLVTGATTSVGLQLMSKQLSGSVEKIFILNLRINIIISVLFALVFSFFSKQIMAIYGQDYKEYYYLIYVVCGVSIFATISSVFDKFLIVKNAQNYVFISRLISSVLVLVSMKMINMNNMAIQIGVLYLIYYLAEMTICCVACLKIRNSI